MKDFVNEFKPIQDALESRGFTLYDGDGPCFIAKYAENKYIVIATDYDHAQVWNVVARDITDAEFVSAMTGDHSEYDALYADSTIKTLPLAWALGFDGIA